MLHGILGNLRVKIYLYVHWHEGNSCRYANKFIWLSNSLIQIFFIILNTYNYLFQWILQSGNQSGGTKISGIEIKEHIHGNAVSTLFNESQSSDEKFKIICEKYTELYADFSVLQLLAKRQEKEMELKKNENEIFECEIAKQNLSREKLEHLCRELQKQNKEIRVSRYWVS